MMRYILPLGIFIALVGFLAVGLQRDPREIPSPLIDKPAPVFSLTQLHQPEQAIGSAQMKGQVWALNVWASWCVACRQEHAVVKEFAAQKVIPVIGLNYKDQRPDALAWLEQFGNPYQSSAYDDKGRVGIDFGVYGVPETFLIDKRGVIRAKQIGPLTPEVIATRWLPLIAKLKAEAVQ
jgi:cytochrome c biogenesis protein CcmG/thiol:disulfide interchange protein DsbE